VGVEVNVKHHAILTRALTSITHSVGVGLAYGGTFTIL
jgi:hypothetical protein